MISKILSIYKSLGMYGLLNAVASRIVAKKAKCFPLCINLISNGPGLEIGGPSNIFQKSHILPIYPYINKLDNCNYSNNTIWEGNILSGNTFKYDNNKRYGQQYILEATNLKSIKSGSYDFILSSHVLEHIANPLGALYEWIRVLKNEGILIMIFPHKERTFDNKREVTDLSHIIGDYEHNTDESDLRHLSEILNLHDLKKDPAINGAAAFKDRSEKNYINRCLHHHVFNTYGVAKLVHHLNLQILAVEAVLPFHIIIIAKKIIIGNLPANDNYLGNDAECLRESPFKSDGYIY